MARLAGVPNRVVQRAKDVLAGLEKKARDAKAQAPAPQATCQSLLPGLPSVETASPEALAALTPHPLLLELSNVMLDSITPLDALNILSDWKARWSGDKDTQGE